MEDKLVFLNENKRKDEMKKYHHLHQIDIHNNYGRNVNIWNINLFGQNKEEIKKTKLAEYIKKNYDHMDEKEMRSLVNKCLEINDVKRILLEYELQYYQEKPKEISLEKFIQKAKKILDRYQWKAGGFSMEDNEWIINTKSTDDYHLKEYEIAFENNIYEGELESYEIQTYLGRLVSRLSKLSNDIKIKLRYLYDEKNKNVLILILAIDKRLKKHYSKKMGIQ